MSFYQFFKSGSIVVGQTESNPIGLNEGTAMGIITGSNVTASTLSIKVSADGTNFYPLYKDDNTEFTVTTTSGSARAYSFSIKDMMPWCWLRVCEGVSASYVTQKVVDTTFTIDARIF
jgi:hypothetical protein